MSGQLHPSEWDTKTQDAVIDRMSLYLYKVMERASTDAPGSDLDTERTDGLVVGLCIGIALASGAGAAGVVDGNKLLQRGAEIAEGVYERTYGEGADHGK